MNTAEIHATLVDQVTILRERANQLEAISRVAPDELTARLYPPMQRARNHMRGLQYLKEETPTPTRNEMLVAGIKLASCELDDAQSRIKPEDVTATLQADMLRYLRDINAHPKKPMHARDENDGADQKTPPGTRLSSDNVQGGEDHTDG